MAGTTLAGTFAQGVDGSKPAASTALEGYVYFSTDVNGGTLYQCKSSAWVQLTTGVTAIKPNGLTGAVAATRLVGGTTSSSPVSGTFAVGDFVVAQNGVLWICTGAGTPGTWASASGGGVTSLTGTSNEIIASGSTGAVTLSTPQAIGTASSPTFATIAAGGITGAVAASRHAGGVASGAPASGTFLLGDFTVDQTGKMWVCTSAGTPGTWVQVGGSAAALTGTSYTRTAGDYTTTSTTFVDVDGTNLALTITTGAHRVLIGLAGVAIPATGTVVTFDVTVDGTRQGGAYGLVWSRDAGPNYSNVSFVYLTAALGAGSHTFKLQWHVSAGTGALAGNGTSTTYTEFWVMEQGG